MHSHAFFWYDYAECEDEEIDKANLQTSIDIQHHAQLLDVLHYHQSIFSSGLLCIISPTKHEIQLKEGSQLDVVTVDYRMDHFSIQVSGSGCKERHHTSFLHRLLETEQVDQDRRHHCH